jgi:hypothetical protein
VYASPNRIIVNRLGKVGLLGWERKTTKHRTAIFRQVNKEKPAAHHDALEFPDGRIELLTILCEGQAATVLQLPAQQTITAEADAQKHRLRKLKVGDGIDLCRLLYEAAYLLDCVSYKKISIIADGQAR